jgi:hypothetical protein
MSNKDLRETLEAIGRTPDIFRRDTLLLLKTLDEMKKLTWTLPEFQEYTTVPLSLDNAVNSKIAYDEAADITDGASDDEK